MPKQTNSIIMTRIKNNLYSKFEAYIDMSDINKPKTDEQYVNHFLSRALVATALMKNNAITEEEACKHITDGENDGGIDGIYINDQTKTINLIQSKYHVTGQKTITHGDLLKFFEGINHLIEANFSSFNSKIQNLSEKLKNALGYEDYKVLIELVYTGPTLDEKNTKFIDNYIKDLNNDGEGFAIKEILSLSGLSEYIVTNKFCEKIDIKKLTIFNLNKVSEPQDFVFGLIDAKELVHLYKTYGNMIFSSNIRYFRGDTDVNQGIKGVIENEKENFVLFNNGIKAICDSMTRLPENRTSKDLGHFSIKNFSIVNGAQTTGSLSLFDDENLEGVKVFITIISMENAENASELSHNITTFSNSQNKINPSDFASLDDFHVTLKHNLILDGKDYVFRTGDTAIIPEEAISLYNLTVASACCKDLKSAATIKNGFNRVFVNRTTTPYIDFFNSRIDKHFAWNIAKIYELVSQQCKRFAAGKDNLDYTIPTHGINYISYLLFKLIRKNTRIKLDSEYIKQLDIWKNEIYRVLSPIIEKIKPIINEKFSSSIISNVFRTARKVNILDASISIDDLTFNIVYGN